MPAQQLIAAPDQATVERLATAFNRCFETFDAEPGPVRPGGVLRSPSAAVAVPARMARMRSPPSCARSPTGSLDHRPGAAGAADRVGFRPGARGNAAAVEVARRLWLCEVRDGRITEVLGYCNGGWDAQLRARHAVEAPMLRP